MWRSQPAGHSLPARRAGLGLPSVRAWPPSKARPLAAPRSEPYCQMMEREPSHAIRVQGLTKRYGEMLAVDGIDFAVPPGATVGLLGGNGAGKTTTIAMLLGPADPDRRHDRGARPRHGARPVRRPGADEFLLALRVAAAAAVGGGEPAGLRPSLQRAARSSGGSPNWPTNWSSSDLLDRPAGELSAGQKTRVALAKALINRPELLLLDEPTASLDPDTGDWVRTWLERYRAESGCTILLASHNMAEVERLCSHVLMLKQGRIVDRGSPEELLDRYGREDMEEVFLDIARDRVAQARERRRHDDGSPRCAASGG